ncbi:THO complex subunit 1 transcription elongation factor-domain-containing protein [Jimgerdemannia flammicorona]|uniref:THO complex subunit 1 transcription elongation factor-domain-containing protein n=1 Tax=Jimgerdemannia flammicorona TaxID=994334 RepID=A0A433PBS9_9FUNG|nr:THO complex subunit 1 transcription elongation factor-domain-containing protein [Jimgerdemannia flammicorona]
MAGSKNQPPSSTSAATAGAPDEEHRTRKRKHRNDEAPTAQEIQDVKREFFFPKFLTSQNLLKLEMADPYFRRHVLVQFLIIFEYLTGFPGKDRELPSAKPNPVKLAHAINEAQETWIHDTRKKVVDELKATPPDGRKFSDTVLMVLKRDRNWIQWKANSCHTFEETPLGEDAYKDFPAKRQKLEAHYPSYRWKLGTSELTRLWKKADDVLPLMHHARLWRALRLGSTQHLHLFRDLFGNDNPAALAKDETKACTRLSALIERDRLGPAAKASAVNGEAKTSDEVKAEEPEPENEPEPEPEPEAMAEAEGVANGSTDEPVHENGIGIEHVREAMAVDREEGETESEVKVEGRLRNDSESEDEVHLVKNGELEAEIEVKVEVA